MSDMTIGSDLLSSLAETGTVAVLVARWTLLLALAWLVHAALVGRNPRWRVALWRGAIVGVGLVAAHGDVRADREHPDRPRPDAGPRRGTRGGRGATPARSGSARRRRPGGGVIDDGAAGGRCPPCPAHRRPRTRRGPRSDRVLAIGCDRTGRILGVVYLAVRHARPHRPADPGEPGPRSARPTILRCAGGHRARMPGDRRASRLDPYPARRPLGGGRDPLPRRDRPPRAAAPRSRGPGRPARHPGS